MAAFLFSSCALGSILESAGGPALFRPQPPGGTMAKKAKKAAKKKTAKKKTAKKKGKTGLC